MPQLDANAFIVQYVGIATLLITVYFIMSYLVLPVILRAMLIRNSFLSSTLSLTLVTQNLELDTQSSLVFRQFNHSYAIINSIFSDITKYSCVVFNVLKGYVGITGANVAGVNSQVTPTLSYNFSVGFAIDYLSLFLLVGLEEENNNNI